MDILQIFDSTIFPVLLADGLTNGAIYALLSLALVLVFAVTRVIFVPQGDFVMFGTLTLATLQLGQVPGTLTLVLVLLFAAGLMNLSSAVQRGDRAGGLRGVATYAAFGAGLWALISWLAPQQAPLWVQVLLTLLLVVPMGPLLYRVIFQPLKGATTLVLLIAAVALHLVLVGLGLAFFGPEGSRTPAFIEGSFTAGTFSITNQNLLVIVVSALLMLGLYLYFDRTLSGKALRATAVNRMGARLVGIRPEGAGALAFGVAAFIGALSGLLIGPSIAITYDSGFLIGLKGFVGAIIGGLVSYPIAAAGALFVGLLESFASFSFSQWKEVIVFTLILPVLLWRSLGSHHEDEE